MKVTVPSATTQTGNSYDMLQSLIGNYTNWFAWVDDTDYVKSGGDKCVACFGANTNSGREVWRNDVNYGYYRRMGYGTSTCKIPAGTVFSVIILPTQPE